MSAKRKTKRKNLSWSIRKERFSTQKILMSKTTAKLLLATMKKLAEGEINLMMKSFKCLPNFKKKNE